MRWLAVLGLGALLAAEVSPGSVEPAAPAEPQAVIFLWDHYRSVAVVGEGVGLRRPATSTARAHASSVSLLPTRPEPKPTMKDAV